VRGADEPVLRRLLVLTAVLLVGVVLVAYVVWRAATRNEPVALPFAAADAAAGFSGQLLVYDTALWEQDPEAPAVRADLLDRWSADDDLTVEPAVLDAVAEHAALLADPSIDPTSYTDELDETRFVETNRGLALEVTLTRSWRYVELDEDSGMVDAYRLHIERRGDRAVAVDLEWQPENGWRD